VCRKVAAVPEDGLALNYGMRSTIEMLRKAQKKEGLKKFVFKLGGIFCKLE
jgi:hypothetical protein